MMIKKKIIERVTIAGFAGFLGILTVVNLFSPNQEYSENENRMLAQFPECSLKNILSGKFDDEFEKWFSDQFVNRDQWIEMKSAFKKATGSIENNAVYYADDGKLIGQFQSYSESTLEQNISTIQTFCETNSITANILMVPTASTMDQQSLPSGAYEVDQVELSRKLATAFSQQNYIDVITPLQSGTDLYFHTDHHWNTNGAYLGYTAIAKSVLQKEPEEYQTELVSDHFYGTMYSKSGAFWVPADPIYRMEPQNKELKVQVSYEDGTVSDSLFSESRLNEKDKYTYYVDGNHAEVTITTNANTGRKALIVKDSYAHILIPYLASEYDEIEMIDLRYYHSPVSDFIQDPKNTDLYFIYSMDNFAEDPNLVFLR